MTTDDELTKEAEATELAPQTVTGELLDAEVDAIVKSADADANSHGLDRQGVRQRYYLRYLLLPFLFLSVALFGGFRLSGLDNSFIFLKPALLCLIFASILLLLFIRSGMIRLEGWFNEAFSVRHNIANGVVLFSLFAATTQLFNSLIPEQGLPFWIVSFCFLWTLWNNLFAEFDTKKLFRSLGGLFGFAFIAKYLVLANLAAPADKSWLRSVIENPGQQAATWLLDLPQFASGTGYIQFFVVALYLLGLYLTPDSADE